MFASHGCTDNTAVVESFKEALLGRIGADRYRMWFAQGVDFTIATSSDAVGDEAAADNARCLFVLRIRGQFALDRLRKYFLREIRGAAMQSGGADVQLCQNL